MSGQRKHWTGCGDSRKRGGGGDVVFSGGAFWGDRDWEISPKGGRGQDAWELESIGFYGSRAPSRGGPKFSGGVEYKNKQNKQKTRTILIV